MGRKARKPGQQSDFDPYDDFNDGYDEEIDIRDLSSSITVFISTRFRIKKCFQIRTAR